MGEIGYCIVSVQLPFAPEKNRLLRINQNVFNFKEKSTTGDQQASHNTHVCRTQAGSGCNDCF